MRIAVINKSVSFWSFKRDYKVFINQKNRKPLNEDSVAIQECVPTEA